MVQGLQRRENLTPGRGLLRCLPRASALQFNASRSQLSSKETKGSAVLGVPNMKYEVSGNADLYDYLVAHSCRPCEHLEGLHKVSSFILQRP